MHKMAHCHAHWHALSKYIQMHTEILGDTCHGGSTLESNSEIYNLSPVLRH